MQGQATTSKFMTRKEKVKKEASLMGEQLERARLVVVLALVVVVDL